jgi:hypothetical protein
VTQAGGKYDFKKLAEDVGPLPHVKRSPDPGGDFLLAMVEAGRADTS